MGSLFTATIESPSASVRSLLVTGLSVGERLGSLPAMTFEVATAPDSTGERSRMSPEELIGAEIAVLLLEDGLEVRRFCGLILAAAELDGTHLVDERFSLTVGSRAASLAFVESQEVFVDASLPDLLREKLTSVKLEEGVDFEIRLTGEHAPRELVVQYKETDLAFLSRLAEHVGATLFVEPRDGAEERLVVTDHLAGFTMPEAAALPFDGTGARKGMFSLREEARAVSRVYAVQDYNYRAPLVDIVADHELESGLAGGRVEYGTHVKSVDEAAWFARVRAEEQECRRVELEGQSSIAGLASGSRRRVSDHPRHDGLEVLITQVDHEATFNLSGEDGSRSTYRNVFRAVRTSTCYRPERKTPRPRIHGFLTGVVQADPKAIEPIGSRPVVDEHARYWVTFHFDTASVERPRTSRPIRMAQQHAGPGFGTHFPLHPGVEVVVGFADGDPDRPVILGAVPNAIAPSPVHAERSDRARIRTSAGVNITFGTK